MARIIHDNGLELKDGEHCWAAFVPYNAKEPKVVVARADGERPYQQINVTGEYPGEIWLLAKCDVPEAIVVVEDGRKVVRLATLVDEGDGRQDRNEVEYPSSAAESLIDATALTGTTP